MGGTLDVRRLQNLRKEERRAAENIQGIYLESLTKQCKKHSKTC